MKFSASTRGMDQPIANAVTCAIVSFRLDYCNVFLASMSGLNLDKLHRVQNCLAQLVTGTRRRHHIKLVLKELHWLPIRARMSFRIMTLVHKVRTSHQPSYLADFINMYRPTRTLQSSSMTLLDEPPMRTSTSRRCFH